MTSYGEGQTCDDLEAQANSIGRQRTNMCEDLPVLNLPNNIQSSNGGMGGRGNEYHSDVVVSTEMSRANLMSYLNDQIRDQGWIFDTSWSVKLVPGERLVKEITS
tara:strand:+ start:1977 stop:2291 length:315 start_codon:yes stop_codon:yes gene_type:complete